MSWLYNKIKTTELAENIPKNLGEDALQPKNFFEMDDNTTGVDIDGYLFFPKKVDSNESFSHREFIRTKIMSGGEFVTRGQYIPKEFSFETIIDIDPDHLDDYLNIFSVMENKVCRITSPYMGGMFKGEVNVNVTNPESSPHVIECKVTVKEIPSAMARLKGDPVINYPSINTVSDITIKQRGNNQKTDENKHKDIYDSYTSSGSDQF